MPRDVGPAAFFTTAYRGATEGILSLWEPREKLATHLCVTRDASAAASAVEMAGWTDVYFGCGVRHPSITQPKVRGGSDDVIALAFLWLEVDLAGPGHRRESLPEKKDDVRRILADGLPPSIVVHSGGGLHLYWLLSLLWTFADADDRARAAALLRRFQASYIANAGAHGWHVDNTSDLARVLRVPGTVNRKEGMERPVRIIDWHPERRYSINQLEAILPVEAPATPPPPQPVASPSTSPAKNENTKASGVPAKVIIDAFNEAHSVEAILATHGYKKAKARPRGDVSSIWLAPTSESRMPGVKVFTDGRVFSHHSSDPLHDVHSHDAFDLYRILEHDGDTGEAVKDAAKALGIVKETAKPQRRTGYREWEARFERALSQGRP